jgi:hypothetical protein
MQMQPEQEHHDEEAEEDDGSLRNTMNALYSTVLEDRSKLARTTADFEAVYFGGDSLMQTTGSGSKTRKTYKLPSTFYMTQYRRMGADVMR